MTNIKIQYSPYELEFTQPFTTANSTLNSRKGFIIILTDDKGRKGFGEAAPLSEFGSETYDAAEVKLNSLKLELNIDFNDRAASIENGLKVFDSYPAIKHGIEQALLKLTCIQKNISLNELLNQESRSEIPVNAAVGFLSPSGTLKKVKELVKEGYSTIKLKAGREKFSEDLDRMRMLRNEFDKNLKLRIDVNGKWKLKDAVSNLKRLEKFNLEYAEQPVKTLDEMSQLAKETSVPLAPDESIRSFKDAELFITKKISHFIILKPMMTGGLLPVIRIIELANQNKIIPIITTSFESVIGRAFAVFAASTVNHEYAHGLSTGSYFKKDIAADPYPVKTGKIIMKGKQ